MSDQPTLDAVAEEPHRAHLGGWQRVYQFANGYGASVICTPFSYGGANGLNEVAVLDSAGHLTYDTPITSDVIGWLSRGETEAVLRRIADLPKAGA